MSLIKQKNTGNVIIAAGQSGCCPDIVDAICKYNFTITSLTAITSITIDGNLHTITATDETDPGDIVEAIENAFYDEGYVIANDKDMIPNVQVIIDIDDTSILIFTNAATVTMDTTPAATATKHCIYQVSCRYHARIPVGAISFEISDAEVEASDPADSPQVVSGTFATGDGDLLAAELDTEIGELYANTTNAALKRIRVVEATDGFYDVDVWFYGRRPFVTDDENIVFELMECTPDFTIAN